MAYGNEIQAVGKCVLGDALRINTHSCVFALSLCGPTVQLRPRLHLIRKVSRQHTIRHTRYNSPAQQISSYQRPLLTWHTANTMDQYPCPHKQLDQQDERLLIYCILNSLFLKTNQLVWR